MSENDYTIAEEFLLPSGGTIYSPQIDPYVKLRSMTIRDELKRTNAQALTIHRSLCEIIDSCLLTKLPVSCYDLAVGDYEYLLHKLRVVTYGSEYKMIVGCPHCSSVYETSVNLDELVNKPFDLAAYMECLNITLPVSKKQIKLRIQTPRILDSVEVKTAEFKKKQPEVGFDPKRLIMLQEMIDTVDGVKLNYVELETFIDHLSARDFNFIENKITKANQMIGLDTSIDVTCRSCGGDIKTFFRFGPEFFRPTNDE